MSLASRLDAVDQQAVEVRSTRWVIARCRVPPVLRSHIHSPATQPRIAPTIARSTTPNGDYDDRDERGKHPLHAQIRIQLTTAPPSTGSETPVMAHPTRCPSCR